MRTFKLVFSDDIFGVAKRIEFDGPDASIALSVARDEVPGRTAELWEKDERLCTIRRALGGGFWVVDSRSDTGGG